MLILTRKMGEGITIGDDIKIIIMQIKGKQVRLGIKADSSIKIQRDEIFEKPQKKEIKENLPLRI